MKCINMGRERHTENTNHRASVPITNTHENILCAREWRDCYIEIIRSTAYPILHLFTFLSSFPHWGIGENQYIVLNKNGKTTFCNAIDMSTEQRVVRVYNNIKIEVQNKAKPRSVTEHIWSTLNANQAKATPQNKKGHFLCHQKVTSANKTQNLIHSK